MNEQQHEEPEYVCDACGESFPSEAVLQEHIRNVGIAD